MYSAGVPLNAELTTHRDIMSKQAWSIIALYSESRTVFACFSVAIRHSLLLSGSHVFPVLLLHVRPAYFPQQLVQKSWLHYRTRRVQQTCVSQHRFNSASTGNYTFPRMPPRPSLSHTHTHTHSCATPPQGLSSRILPVRLASLWSLLLLSIPAKESTCSSTGGEAAGSRLRSWMLFCRQAVIECKAVAALWTLWEDTATLLDPEV